MRLRRRLTKLGMVRWPSHRDVAGMWGRADRRADLPVAYTAGFSPRPRVSFGLALSTGHEGVAEYLDVELHDHELDVGGLPERLTPALPEGLDVMAAAVIDRQDPSLQEAVTSCTWRIEVDRAALPELVATALAADTLLVTRQRKGRTVTDDLRPAILSLDADGTELWAELACQGRGVRPSELLEALEPGLVESRVCRMHQWIERHGARWEPLSLSPELAEVAP